MHKDEVLDKIDHALRHLSAKKSIDGVSLRHLVAIRTAFEDYCKEEKRFEKAMYRTLVNANYTYHGGELWKPPMGPNPFLSPLLAIMARSREISCSVEDTNSLTTKPKKIMKYRYRLLGGRQHKFQDVPLIEASNGDFIPQRTIRVAIDDPFVTAFPPPLTRDLNIRTETYVFHEVRHLSSSFNHPPYHGVYVLATLPHEEALRLIQEYLNEVNNDTEISGNNSPQNLKVNKSRIDNKKP